MPGTDQLADDTQVINIYPKETVAGRWEKEKKENDESWTEYIQRNVQENRAEKQVEDTSPSQEHEKKVEELQEEIKDLRAELQKEREKGENEFNIKQTGILEDIVSDTPKELDQIVQEIVESGEIQTLLAHPLEKYLYELAEEGKIRYQTYQDNGWRIQK